MNWALLLSIAKALLLARLKQSIVAAAGVTFGITMFISLMGFMTGLNGLLDGLILNRTAHIRLYNELRPSDDQPIEKVKDYKAHRHFIRSIKPKDVRAELHNSQAIMQVLNASPEVKGLAPRVVAQVFYNIGGVRLNGVVNGIEVENEMKLFAFNDYLVEGKPLDLNTVSNSILLGKGVADKIMAKPGDIVQLTSPLGKIFSLKVVGLFQVGMAEIDNVQSYASIRTTQKLLGKPNSYITDIQVKLHDLNTAPELARDYARRFNVDALDIQTANAQFETGTAIRNIITYAVSFTLLLVAGFGIYNILNMLIYEKMDSIAIMKATGFSGGDVQAIFILLSMIIGVVGGVAGLGLGFVFSSLIDAAPFETEALPTIKTFPVSFNPLYYLSGLLFALGTTYIAGWLPARKASSIDPVDIIRGK